MAFPFGEVARGLFDPEQLGVLDPLPLAATPSFQERLHSDLDKFGYQPHHIHGRYIWVKHLSDFGNMLESLPDTRMPVGLAFGRTPSMTEEELVCGLIRAAHLLLQNHRVGEDLQFQQARLRPDIYLVILTVLRDTTVLGSESDE